MSNKRRKLSPEERLQLYEKFDGHCAYCGIEFSFEEMTSDHVKALERGGEDVFENLFPACKVCNHYKNRYSVEQFRKRLRESPKMNTKEEIISRYGNSSKERITFFYERSHEKVS